MNMKEIRELSGLTQAAFAAKYEIPLRTLQSWESGEREPAAYILKMLERIVKEDYPENE